MILKGTLKGHPVLVVFGYLVVDLTGKVWGRRGRTMSLQSLELNQEPLILEIDQEDKLVAEMPQEGGY